MNYYNCFHKFLQRKEINNNEESLIGLNMLNNRFNR